MAPESERAKCPNCGATDHYRDIGSDCEPTLTCSEVVERLAAIADECYHGPYDHGCPHGREIARDIRTQATAILHSWRERRVQELEEALRITSASIAKEMNRYDYEELDGSGAIITAEEVYKQSLEKAAEQIRKGAKHGEG